MNVSKCASGQNMDYECFYLLNFNSNKFIFIVSFEYQNLLSLYHWDEGVHFTMIIYILCTVGFDKT